MSDISDTIKYLYREFILRDLLSFITPGAIIICAMLLLEWDLSQILTFTKLIPLVLYIPIFGAFFMVGFAIQCLGAEIFHVIKFHHRKIDKEHFTRLATFRSKADEKAERQHERFVILKQMCGNSAVAIFIASVLLVIKRWIPCVVPWVLGAMVIAIVISLYWGHLVHVRRQEEWEDLNMQQTTDKC